MGKSKADPGKKKTGEIVYLDKVHNKVEDRKQQLLTLARRTKTVYFNQGRGPSGNSPIVWKGN